MENHGVLSSGDRMRSTWNAAQRIGRRGQDHHRPRGQVARPEGVTSWAALDATALRLLAS
jgi:hypothetical protein